MLIATPNLCLDRTELVAELVPGAVLRALAVEVTAGGKGVNVARVLRAYGRRATLVGLVADHGREHLLGLLRDEGADIVDVPVAGEVRMAMIIMERPGGRITVLNEPGPTLSAVGWSDYRRAVERQLPGQRILACSGSLPPGAPLDAYGQLVELAHRAGVPALVDTAPAALRASLPAGPDLVSPNLAEAEAALSGASGALLADADRDVGERAAAAAVALCRAGAQAAVVTAGSAGAALALGSPAAPEDGAATVRWLDTVAVDVVSAVGAGDALVAGVMLAVETTPAGGPVDWTDAVRRGIATATASCEQLRAGGVEPARADALLRQIQDLAGTPARPGAAR